MNKVTIEPFQVIGIEIRTNKENDQAVQDITQLWQRWMSENLIAMVPHKASNAVYCMYTEYDGDHTKPYTVVLGCPVKNLDFIPDGMVGKSFEGGTYDKRTVMGNLADGIIVNAWQEIWNAGLPRAFTADFEIFDERSLNPQNVEVDILVSVQS